MQKRGEIQHIPCGGGCGENRKGTLPMSTSTRVRTWPTDHYADDAAPSSLEWDLSNG